MNPSTLFAANRMLRLAFLTLLVSALAGAAACTFLLDRSTTECRVAADCAKFGVQPSCVDGACVDTHIPCFFGTPNGESSLLNACTPATCVLFDDCNKLGVCGDAGLPPLASPPPVAPAAGNGSHDGGGLRLCAELAAGTTVPVVTGSSNFPTLLDSVAPLVAQGALQLQVGPSFIWQTTSSCIAADALWSDDAGAHVIHDPPPGSGAAGAVFYNQDGRVPCLLGDAGMTVTVGESDVFSETCNPAYTLSGDIDDKPGPIQAMVFVVPKASLQTAISQNAAYEVFGLGGMGARNIPWTNPNRFYIRSKTAGTQQMIGKEIGVPPDQFWGIDQRSATGVDMALTGLIGDQAEHAIGILSVTVSDGDPNLKALAYQRTSQDCAFLPGSTSRSFDKANVRDGHYPIWGPLHFFTSTKTAIAERISNMGVSPSQAFVNFFAGDAVNPKVLDAFIAARLVPLCAMTVTRTDELGALAPSSPQNSCGCYFDFETTGSVPPECKPCTADNAATACPAARPACNFNYCEPN